MSVIDTEDIDGEVEGAEQLTPVQIIRKEKRRLLMRSPGFIFGCLVVLFWLVAAIAPSVLTERGPKDDVAAEPFVSGQLFFSDVPGRTDLGGITATLLDPAGVPVPGVDTEQTDSEGNYRFTDLEAGTYTVGFADGDFALSKPGQSTRESLLDEPPSGAAWFGVDRLGRDVYSRTIFGARPILIAAPVATLVASIIGTLLGLLTGYYRGWTDEIISRILEAILSIPAILLAIVIIFTFGPTPPVVIGTIAFLFIPPVARTVRAATLSESQLDYVTAARMRGESSLYIIAREIFPNVIGVVTVEITVRLGYAVFTLSTLAFLGLGGGNRTDANWGVDVADNYERIVNGSWWPTLFPALAIASLVIGVNLIADSIERVNKS